MVYLPHFFSWVIVGGIFNTLLSPTNGIVNIIIEKLGGEAVFFMADKGWFRWVLAFSNSWKEAGWGTIIYLAAISSISPELYEAAMIDGASKFQRLRFITLPAIVTAIIVVFTLSIKNILLLFEQVFVMYNPAVAEVSETIGTYVYVVGIQQGDISFSVAVGIFQGFTSLIIVLALNWFSKRVAKLDLF
jgi:putative aldouronate transport system permease protein